MVGDMGGVEVKITGVTHGQDQRAVTVNTVGAVKMSENKRTVLGVNKPIVDYIKWKEILAKHVDPKQTPHLEKWVEFLKELDWLRDKNIVNAMMIQLGGNYNAIFEAALLKNNLKK
jgi:hypothetical protein